MKNPMVMAAMMARAASEELDSRWFLISVQAAMNSGTERQMEPRSATTSVASVGTSLRSEAIVVARISVPPTRAKTIQRSMEISW